MAFFRLATRELIIKDWGYSEVAFWQYGKLFYIDTYGYKLCAFHPQTNHSTCCTIGLLSFVVPVQGQPEEFVVGGANSIILIEWDSSQDAYYPPHVPLESEEELPLGNRWGYGSVDYSSRLWIVTTNDRPEHFGYNTGILYSLDKKKRLRRKLWDLSSVTGGFAWNLPMEHSSTRPVPYRFYFSDTQRREVVVYDFTLRNGGTIDNRQKLFNLTEYGLQGDPGRIAIDDRGWLWVPLLGGGGVIEFDPFTKTRHTAVAIPAAKVGACTFGGHNLEILYVSTIGYKYKLPYQRRPKGDEGGHIYAILHLGVNGVPTRQYFIDPAQLPKSVIDARARRAISARLERTPRSKAFPAEESGSNFDLY